MVKEVILTPLAVENYERILEYLISEWGIPTANNFIERFDQVRIILAKNTEIFPFENRVKQIQKCILTKHNILYFKETKREIKILTIFDTRQDPRKLTKII
jgi:plasmid stabilization system protein ParE